MIALSQRGEVPQPPVHGLSSAGHGGSQHWLLGFCQELNRAIRYGKSQTASEQPLRLIHGRC